MQNFDVSVLAIRRLHEASLLSLWMAAPNSHRVWQFMYQLVRETKQENEAIRLWFASNSTLARSAANVILKEREKHVARREERLEGIWVQAGIRRDLWDGLRRTLPGWRAIAAAVDQEQGGTRHIENYELLYRIYSRRLHLSATFVLEPEELGPDHWANLTTLAQLSIVDVLNSIPKFARLNLPRAAH